MSAPDSTSLAQRLIDAASDAFDVGTFNFDVVVASVLRELAAVATPSEPSGVRTIRYRDVDGRSQAFGLGPWEREGLRGWADAIEKGGDAHA